MLDWDPRNLYRRFFPGKPKAMETFLTEIDFYNWNAQQDKGRTFAEGIAEHSAIHPQYSHLIQSYFDCWEESIIGAIEGSVKILRRLKKKGYPLLGLSNWSAETYPRARDKYPFFDLFDDIVLSGKVGLNKPDPGIFNLLLERTGYTAPECVLIDDSQPNIDAAGKLGFNTIHFTSPDELRTELQRFKVL